jgi:hypothetical protein
MIGLFATVISLILVLGYCQIHKQKTGIFNLSHIPYVNQLHIIIGSGLYQKGYDSEWNQMIQLHIDEYKKMNPEDKFGHVTWRYPTGMTPKAFHYVCWKKRSAYNLPLRIAEYTTRTIQQNQEEYLKYAVKKIQGVSSMRIGELMISSKLYRQQYYNRQLDNIFSGLIKFKTIYILLGLDLFFLIISGIFFKSLQWNWCIAWLWMGCAIFTAVVGSQESWSRLAMPSLPFIIIIFAKYFDLVTFLLKDKVVQYILKPVYISMKKQPH